MTVDKFDDVVRDIGLRIGEMRRAKGLTQQGLATLLLASVQWVSQIETGKRNLTLATMIKISSALNIRVVELFATPKVRGQIVRGRPRSKKSKKSNGSNGSDGQGTR